MYRAGRGQTQIDFRYKEVLQFPESLFRLCLKSVARHLDALCTEAFDGCAFREGLTLPSMICDELIDAYQINGSLVIDSFASLFGDVTSKNLRSVRVHDSIISDQGLLYLLQHNLYELTLVDCPRLTHETFVNILKNSANLRSLTVSACLETSPYVGFWPPPSDDLRTIENAPNLRHLALQTMPISFGTAGDNLFLDVMFDKFLQLRVLDLSFSLDVGSLHYLRKLSNLNCLILSDVPRLQESGALQNVCALRSLEVLDLSQTDLFEGTLYENENEVLARIVESLPNLKSLDISGTNLDGKESSMSELLESDIPGLNCRVDNPLDFLGLFHTVHSACLRPNIPARIISGNANEEQLYNAVALCMNKPIRLQYVISDLFQMLWLEEITKLDQALDIVLEVLTRYVDVIPIQIHGIESLYCIMKSKNRPLILNDVIVKRRIVTALLTGVEHHEYDATLVSHVFMVLCQLKIPQDVIFEIERIVQMLLDTVPSCEGYIKRSGIYLLNLVACQADNKQKQKLGDADIIKKMLVIIKDRLRRMVCDVVLVVAWSVMWNVTDGVPINCARFLDRNGMKYFLECLLNFSDNHELMRNMMGLLGNVAEVKKLRPMLMSADYIKTVSHFFLRTQYGIEVSYHAAYVIAYLAFDGHKAWTINRPSRHHVLDHMTEAIYKWNLGAVQNINYHSIKPILKLAQVRHTPQCVHWAAWALANLTNAYPQKYCQMVIAEKGLKIMSDLLKERVKQELGHQSRAIEILAQSVISQCQNFTNIV